MTLAIKSILGLAPVNVRAAATAVADREFQAGAAALLDLGQLAASWEARRVAREAAAIAELTCSR